MPEEKPPSLPVVVWDFPLRLFHWSLVIGIVIMIVTANLGSRFFQYHLIAGQGILVLLLFRVIWGFAGGEQARFKSFIYHPKALKHYLKGELTLDYSRDGGHNPLGALSVWLMLGLLSIQVITGLFATDDIRHSGPLNFLVYGELESWLTSAHHLNLILLLIVIGLHIGAIFYYKMVKHVSLIAPMWHGWKPAGSAPNFSFKLAAKGLVVLALSTVLTLSLLWLLQNFM